MTRVAAIDCGTNSLRLLVADIDDGVKIDVHREMRIVRLGEGVDRTGELAPQALARTRAALIDYAATIREAGAQASRMVATSATRDARNRSKFVALVQQTLGVEPEVVSGAEEARLSFEGATRELEPELGPFLVMDIGGGSTEFVVGAHGRVGAGLSVDVGCVRLTERYLLDDPPTAGQIADATAEIDRALNRVLAAVPIAEAQTALGLAGTVTTVAALALGLPEYDPVRLQHSRITAEQIRRVTADLLAMPSRDRARLPVMHPGRVDVIGGGALVLGTAVDRFDVREIVVSESDILDGIAWSMVTREQE